MIQAAHPVLQANATMNTQHQASRKAANTTADTEYQAHRIAADATMDTQYRAGGKAAKDSAQTDAQPKKTRAQRKAEDLLELKEKQKLKFKATDTSGPNGYALNHVEQLFTALFSGKLTKLSNRTRALALGRRQTACANTAAVVAQWS